MILIFVIRKESFPIACLEVLDSVKSYSSIIVGLSSSSQKSNNSITIMSRPLHVVEQHTISNATLVLPKLSSMKVSKYAYNSNLS